MQISSKGVAGFASLSVAAAGRIAITQVRLHPVITFGGEAPDEATLERMHHLAHEQCFIANSVTTEVLVS